MNIQEHNRVQDHLDYDADRSAPAETLERYRRYAQEAIEESPTAVTLAVFGAGFAVGTIIGGVLADSDGGFRRRSAEHVGQRVLAALTDAMPDALQRHLRD